MSKNYNKKEPSSINVSEPLSGYDTRRRNQVSQQNTLINERVMAKTVSVDEYFDELIAQIVVHNKMKIS